VGHRAAWMGLAGVVALATGCQQQASHDAERELEQVRRDGAALNASLDNLEERYFVDRAQVDLWKELRVRHEHVSAVATVNAQDHMASMFRSYEHQMAKSWQPQGRGRQHLAASEPAGASAGSAYAR
jgi:hypothetical protein